MRTKKGIKISIGIILVVVSVIGGIYYTHPRPYRQSVEQFARQFNVDKHLIYAMIKVESNFNSNAISRKGAKGLMQIMDTTGTWGAEVLKLKEYTNDQLFHPNTNLQIGTWYIGKLLKQYENTTTTALAAYNAGSGNVAKWKKNTLYSIDGKELHTIPFKETSQYVKKVNWHYTLYNILYRN